MPKSIMPVGLSEEENITVFRVDTEDGHKTWNVSNDQLLEIALMFAQANTIANKDKPISLITTNNWKLGNGVGSVSLILEMVGPIEIGFSISKGNALRLSQALDEASATPAESQSLN